MTIDRIETSPVVAGWRLRAWYDTRGTRAEKYDGRMSLFLHPRFQNILSIHGPDPYTEQRVLELARSALYWVLHNERNAKTFMLMHSGVIRRRADDHVRVSIEIEFVTETVVGTVRHTDVLDNPPSEHELTYMGLS
jgi:hypothetical protein